MPTLDELHEADQRHEETLKEHAAEIAMVKGRMSKTEALAEHQERRVSALNKAVEDLTILVQKAATKDDIAELRTHVIDRHTVPLKAVFAFLGALAFLGGVAMILSHVRF